jgi:hypothetical protein
VGSKSPKPLCAETNPIPPDSGTSVRSLSVPPGGIRGPGKPGSGLKPPVQIPTVVFDEKALLKFFQSVARAKALERHTKLEWKEYDESTFLNVLYKCFPWKAKPGYVELRTGDERQIEEEVEKEVEHMMEVFIEKCQKGPAAAKKYLQAQEEIRNSALQTVQQVTQEAKELNREIIEETSNVIKTLVVVKATATITVKTLGLLTGGPGFLVGTGYDVVLDQIEEWDKADKAQLIGIAVKDVAVESGKEVTEEIAEVVADDLESRADAAARKAKWLRKRLDDAEEMAARKAKLSEMSKLSKTQRRYARALAEKSKGKWVKPLRGIKYVFFAHEVIGTILQARDEWKAAEL